MSQLRLSFLGTPIIELDKQLVGLETRKSLAILTYISLTKQEIPREVLATLFWGEYDQVHALSSLRRNLSSLNKSLKFDWLVTRRETISLRSYTDLWVDTEEFMAQQDLFRNHGCQQWEICPECLEYLKMGVKLYRGDFLAGVNLRDCPEFDDWQSLQREIFRTQYAYYLEKLSLAHAYVKNWEKALQYSRKWVALDPLNEAAQRMLIQQYALSGNRNAALSQYQKLINLLKEELGTEPEKDSIALFQYIKSHQHQTEQDLIEPHPPGEQINPVSQPILKIKTYIPSFTGNKVLRSRLLASMQEGLDHPLTLISAPAGFGKTTLLSEWASVATMPVAWFSIDKSDNDLVQFMTYMTSALESIQPGIGSEVLLMLRSFRPIPAQSIQVSFCNRLLETKTPFAVVLDDYHLIETQEIHQFLTYILEHLPPNVHVILSTRSDPPIPLSRLRARRQMVELRSQDLRFTPDESLDFLNEVMGLSLSAEEIAILETRTEGWVVGLQLAALSLRGRKDIGSFIQAFSGSHQYILDYLVEEVLSRQPDDILHFLLRTSVLERLNSALCNAVTGRQNSQDILETLERSNLFLVSLDDERHWYRYHHLFAELLQVRLQEMYPDDIPGLHHRAAQWLEDFGLGTEAIQHAIAAQDYIHAARLIEQSAINMWSGNEGYLVYRWMNALPEEVLQTRPRLVCCKAWVLIHDAHFEEARAVLDAAEKSLIEENRDNDIDPYSAETQGMIYAIRSPVNSNLGNATIAMQDAKNALEFLPNNNLIWRGLAYLGLGFAHEVAGDAEQANQAMIQADITADKCRDLTLSMLIKYNLGDLHLLQGSLREANEFFKQVISLAKLYKAERLHELGEAMTERAWVLCEWNKLEEAEEQIKHGLEIGHNIDSFLIQIMGHLSYARILQALGKFDSAYHEVGCARQISEMNQISIYASAAESYQIRLDLLTGNLDRSRIWRQRKERMLSEALAEKSAFPPHYYESETFTLVRVLFSEGRTTDALMYLDNLLTLTESMNKSSRRIEILVLRALLYQNMNDLKTAWDNVERALCLAEPQSFQRIFLDEGYRMELLLDWGIEQDMIKEDRILAYVENLLHSFPAEQRVQTMQGEKTLPRPVSSTQRIALAEPLTSRENDVLNLMAQGLTNQQIASKMVLSIGTVKMHIHHILEKLEVPSRALAVIRSKELKLLP
jgi:ATP/maltotriose-dependent transcriptional regulator MalT/DNA-binding SARP family transcriptional activator